MGSIKKQPGSVNFQNSLTIKDLCLDVSCYFWLLWRSKYNYQIQPTTKGLSQYDDLLNKLERIKSIVSDCSDKKCKLHSHISVIEELHDNIVYIGLDNDFYSTYQEILKKIPLQKILENGILVSMDNA